MMAEMTITDRDLTARIRGRVDLNALDASVALDVRPYGTDHVGISAPGLFLAVHRRSVDWHCTNQAVCVVLGEPLLGLERTDAKRIAEAFAQGSALGGLGGRYAVVLIDRESRLVHLLTDRFAVQPLCWSRQADELHFSDRADTIADEIGAPLSAQALYFYVYFHMVPATATIFRDVFRLPAATALTVQRSGESVQTTWTPSVADSGAAPSSTELLEAIRGAVARESDDKAVGCFLSGGTDSSTVTGMFKAINGKATTFSMGFDAQGYDEMEYARIAARHFGTEHHEHYVTPAQLVDAAPHVARHYDQPFGNSSAVPAFICAQVAASSGCSKLLAGDGGDELYGGNSRYAKQKIFSLWSDLPQIIRSPAGPLLANGLTRSLPLVRKIASYVDQASVPMPARMETYNLLARFGENSVFTQEFLRSVDTSLPASLQSETWNRTYGASLIDRMLRYDWRFTLADNDLPKVMGTTQLAGMEVGFPLLADEVVDLSLRLPARDKVRGLRLRHYFKESLRDFLPPEIIAKKKHGFGLPVGPWLVSDPNFRDLAHTSLQALVGRGLIRKSLIDDLFSRRLEEHAGYYGEMVWILMMLELWLGARRSASWA